MKKILGAFVAAVTLLGSALALSACADGKHTAHDFTGDWVTTDPESHWHVCTAEGYDETDTKVAHTWVADTDKTDVPATCISDGIHYLKCECGAKKSEAITERPDHDFTGAWVTADPDNHWHVCTAEGCDETDTKAAHTWVADESKTDVPATCISDGTHYVKCSGCGKEKSEAITERPNHDFTGAWVTADPDNHWHVCTADGCDATDTKTAHSWVADESKTDVPATCHSDGTHYVKCSGCGKEKSETITTRPDHDFTGAWVNTDPAEHWHVCAAEGCDATDTKTAHALTDYEKADENVHTKSCECGYAVEEAHSWNDGVVTKEPSATETGIRTYTCELCSETKTEIIPNTSHTHTPNAGWSDDDNFHWHTCSSCSEKLDKVAHSWVADESKTDVPATCHSDGTHYVKCSVCGKEKSEAITTRPDHDFTGDWVTTDPESHWHVCVAEGCDATDTKVAHAFNRYEKADENIHTKSCECGYSVDEAHSWNDGVINKQPTFLEAGEKIYTCGDCGQTKTESIEKLQTADFGKDFSLDANPSNGWSYGKTEGYVFGSDENNHKESFNFIKATDKNAGGDGWVIGGTEINDGFINSDNWATVAFTFTEDTVATVNFKFTGNHVIITDPETGATSNGDPNTFNCRIGVKNENGELYANPTFIGGEGDPNVSAHSAEYNFKKGDTIYFMIEHTGGWASGTLELTITRSQANAG